MDIMQKLYLLQKSIVIQLGFNVDVYYMEGYGLLAVKQGYPFHPLNIVFAFPDIGIVNWR